MAPGRVRRILVRVMTVLENIGRHILIRRSRCQRTAVEGLGRRRCLVAIPPRDNPASGLIPPRGTEECQYRRRFAPSIQRSLENHAHLEVLSKPSNLGKSRTWLKS